MPTNVKIPLPGYTSPVGYMRKLVWSGDLSGSNNYQAGGYQIAATDFGMTGIEEMGFGFGGINISGAAQNTYVVKVKPPANLASNSVGQAPCFATATLQWYVSANNAEVANGTDLSAQMVRANVRGI